MSKNLQNILDGKYGCIAYGVLFVLALLLMCLAFAYGIYVLGCMPGQICVAVQ